MAAPLPNGTLPGNLAATGAGTIGSAGNQSFFSQEQLRSAASNFAPGTTWYEKDGIGVIRGANGVEAAFSVGDPEYEAAKTALNYQVGSPQIQQTAQGVASTVGGLPGGVAGDVVASTEANHPYAKTAVPPTTMQQPVPGAAPYDKSALSSAGITQNIAPVSLLPMRQMPDVPIAPSGAEQHGAYALETYQAPQEMYQGFGDETRGIQETGAQELDQFAAQMSEDDVAKRQAAEAQSKFLREAQGRYIQADDQLKSALAKGVDPNRIFRNGTLGRTDTMVALILGGMANPDNNQNLDLLNKMIERDIDAQKAELSFYGDRAQNMLGFYSQALGGAQAAEHAVRLNMLEMQENRIKAAAARLGGADSQMRAQEMIAQLEQKRAALAVELQNQLHNDSLQFRAQVLKEVQAENASRAAANKARLEQARLNQLKVTMGDKWNPSWDLMLQSGDAATKKLAFEQMGAAQQGISSEGDWNEMKPNQRADLVRKFGEEHRDSISQLANNQRILELLEANPDSFNRVNRFFAARLGGAVSLSEQDRELAQLLAGGRIDAQSLIKGVPSDKDQAIVDQMRPMWGDSAETVARVAKRDSQIARERLDAARAAYGPQVVDRYMQNAEAQRLKFPRGLSKGNTVSNKDSALEPM